MNRSRSELGVWGLGVRCAALLASLIGVGVGCATTPEAKGGGAPVATAAGVKVQDVKVAPDGVHFFLWVRSEAGEDALVFKRVQDRAIVGGFRFPPETNVYSVEWANEHRVVMAVGRDDPTHSTPIFYGDIYAVDLDRSNPRLIFGAHAGKEFTTGTAIVPAEPIEAWGSFLSRIPGSEDEILIASQRWPTIPVSLYANENEPSLFEVYAVSTSTGRRRRVVAGPGMVLSYLVDEVGEVRAAYGLAPDHQEEVHVRDPGGPWRKLPPNLGRPVGVSAKSRALYVIGDDSTGPGLFSVDLQSFERRLVHRRPDAAPGEIAWDQETGHPVAVEYEPGLPLWALLDPASHAGKILGQAVALRPGLHPRFVSTSRDGRLAVVRYTSDRALGQFLLIEADPPWAVQVARVSQVDTPEGSATQPIEVKVSDGTVVRGYLTIGVGVQAPVPLVVMPHGGPHGVRDHWEYDPFVQLLASQGYAVLQVNFRGSAGYGRAFEEAGRRHWGDRVQDDIIEVTRSVIATTKGFEGARVGLVGGSFGGYSALQSARRAPDLFRCAVGIAGIYDLRLMREGGDIVMTRRGRSYLDRSLGMDAAALEAASPTAHPEEVKVPVLLLHGDRDRRAPIAHAQGLCEAIRGAGGRCDLWVAEGEEHNFRGLAAAQADLQVLDFLEAQLKGRR